MIAIEKILKQITEGCKMCKQCDPCCTGYILKKCIEKDKFI